MSAGATRDQLSLFVEGIAGERLDALRREMDPVQAGLIPTHVTLCREDELDGLTPALLAERLGGALPLVLSFGPPERFSGHGVLLPCTAGQADLDALRRRVLGRDDVRHQAAHITLAHPRNPRAPGNRLPSLGEPLTLTLRSVRWIRQHGAGPWQTVACVPLTTTR